MCVVFCCAVLYCSVMCCVWLLNAALLYAMSCYITARFLSAASSVSSHSNVSCASKCHAPDNKCCVLQEGGRQVQRRAALDPTPYTLSRYIYIYAYTHMYHRHVSSLSLYIYIYIYMYTRIYIYIYMYICIPRFPRRPNSLALAEIEADPPNLWAQSLRADGFHLNVQERMHIPLGDKHIVVQTILEFTWIRGGTTYHVFHALLCFVTILRACMNTCAHACLNAHMHVCA